jgi:hypothetical protein
VHRAKWQMAAMKRLKKKLDSENLKTLFEL